MRKKIILLLAALVLGVAIAVFFVDTTPRTPLSAGILVITNDENDSRIIVFSVTNHLSEPCYFFTYPQTLSNGVWSTSLTDRNIFGGTRGLDAHRVTEAIVGTLQQTGLVRLQITYGKTYTVRQEQIDDWLKKLGLRPYFADWQRKHRDDVRPQIVTAPRELPAR